jgi:hypothetical protein
MSLLLDGTNGVSDVDGTAATPAIRGTDANTGISFGTDTVTISTGGVARVTTDASGNVGVGTDSPGQRLSLASSTNDDGIRITNTSAANTTAKTTRITFFGTDTGNTAKEAANIYTIPDGVNYIGASMAFFTRGSDAMKECGRFDPSGNLLVNKTSTGYVNGNNFSFEIGGGTAVFGHVNGGGTLNDYCSFIYNTSRIGGITQNGVSNVSYNTSSDYRLKENVTPMVGALAKVAALNPVTYTWKADGSDGQGFIAHELQAVVPDCVTGEKDAVEIVDDLDDEGKKIGTKEVPRYQGVDSSFLVATIVAALQEQQAIITQQQATISAMETRLAALEA